MRARTRSVVLLLVAGPLTATVGCGDDGDTGDDASDTVVTSTTASSTTASDDESPNDDTTTSAGSTPGTNTGSAGGCEHLDEAADGIYGVGEAGEVEIRREGANLTVVDVRPEEGWEHKIDDDDDDEVEVEFRSDGREAEFEAEIDDGRLEIEVCTTD